MKGLIADVLNAFTSRAVVTGLNLIMVVVNLIGIGLSIWRGHPEAVALHSLIVVVAACAAPVTAFKLTLINEQIGKQKANRAIAEEMLSKVKDLTAAGAFEVDVLGGSGKPTTRRPS